MTEKNAKNQAAGAAPEKPSQKKRLPLALRGALWTITGVAGITAAAAGGAAWLVGTESGRSTALAAAVRWVPGFSAQSVSGPWDDLTISGIAWQSPGITAAVGEARLGWDWRALFDNSVHFSKLELEGVDVKVDTKALPVSEPAAEEASSGPVDLHLPVTAALDKLSLSRVKAEVDGMTVDLEGFQTSAQLADGALTVPAASWEKLVADLSAAADVKIASDAFRMGAVKYTGTAAELSTAVFAGGRVDLVQAPPQAEVQAKAEAPQSATSAEDNPSAAAKEVSVSTSSAVPAAQDESSVKLVQGFAQMLDDLMKKPFIESLPAVTLPLDVKLASLEITNWAVTGLSPDASQKSASKVESSQASETQNLAEAPQPLPGLAPLTLHRIGLSGVEALASGAVTVGGLEVDSSTGRLSANAEVGLSGAWPVKLHLEAEADAEPWSKRFGLLVKHPQTKVSFDLTGEVAGKLMLTGSTLGALDASFSAAADPSKPYLPFDISFSAPELLVPGVVTEEKNASSAGKLEEASTHSQSADDVQAVQTAAAAAQKQHAEKAPAKTQAKPQTAAASKIQGAVQKPADGKTAAASTATGAVEAADGQQAANAADILMRSAWTIRGLEFKASGDARNYSATLVGQPEVSAPQALIAGRSEFKGVIDAALSGTLEGARIDRFTAELPFGRLAASGAAGWAKDLSWQATLKVDGVDHFPSEA